VYLLENLSIGFAAAVTPTNLVYCFVGCLLGTLIGVLPGLGAAASIAMLLPFTYTLEPTPALIMLAGLYYGTQYGGSTTAILVNLPGESSSVVTAIDGYQMARQGRAGLALGTAALGSFFAGSFATLVIAAFSPILTEAALQFGAAEYFSLMVLGLIASVTLAHGSFVKALMMIVLGLLVGIAGVDVTSGVHRFTFGIQDFVDGIDLVAVAMGMFGLSEIIQSLTGGQAKRTAHKTTIRGMLPNWDEAKLIVPAVIRGTGLGTVLGVLPGGGALLSAFASYALEKKLSRDPIPFGQGAVAGVAGPESANNAGAQTSFIPMLTLGIPANATMALMAGAMIIHGIQPGPSVINEQPTLFWGLIVSMWVGNLMLVILNLPLIGIWVRLLTLPYKYLFPAIILFCCIGVFSLNNSTFGVYTMVAFGLFGYVVHKLGGEPAPFLMGMLLGPMMEEYLRRAMLLSRGDPLVFVTRPLSATLLLLALACIVILALPSIRKKREQVLREE
jgi:TctA family transporter